MKVIIQKDLLKRSCNVFNAASKKYGIEFIETEVLDETEMLEQHKNGADCLVIGAEVYSSEFYNSLKEGSAVIRYGVGYNAVPIEICKQRNIIVGYTPGTLADSVAEHTFALLLGVTRKIPELHQSMKNNLWRGLSGIELRGKIMAIIGYGQIGQTVAKIAKYGFGMKVFVLDIRESANDNICDFYSQDFEEVVRDADVISLHLATTPSTIGFLNKERINMMKDGVLLINTARGELINEADLFDALKNRKIKAAGLDVFTQEPYKPTSGKDFRKLENVVLTPHCGSNTSEASSRMAELVVKNILAYYSGTKMRLIPELEKQ